MSTPEPASTPRGLGGWLILLVANIVLLLYSDLVSAPIGFGLALAFFVTWSIYLRRSVRVANTFK